MNLFIQLTNLHDNWINKLLSFAGKSYELKQSFVLKFELNEISNVVV